MPHAVERTGKRTVLRPYGGPILTIFYAADRGQIDVVAQANVITVERIALLVHFRDHLQTSRRADDKGAFLRARSIQVRIDDDHRSHIRILRQFHDDRRIRVIRDLHDDRWIRIFRDIHDDLHCGRADRAERQCGKHQTSGKDPG